MDSNVLRLYKQNTPLDWPMQTNTFSSRLTLSQLVIRDYACKLNFYFFSRINLPFATFFSNSVIYSKSASICTYSLGLSPVLSLFYYLNWANSICFYDSSVFSSVHFQSKTVPFCEIVKILSLSALKKALTILLWLPENVNGKKSLILWSDIILTVRSSLHVMKNRESVDHDTPIISSEWRLPYFL